MLTRGLVSSTNCVPNFVCYEKVIMIVIDIGPVYSFPVLVPFCFAVESLLIPLHFTSAQAIWFRLGFDHGEEQGQVPPVPKLA